MCTQELDRPSDRVDTHVKGTRLGSPADSITSRLWLRRRGGAVGKIFSGHLLVTNRSRDITSGMEPSKLRILLVGNGGREHTLVWKLAQSDRVECIDVVPGNGGTAG